MSSHNPPSAQAANGNTHAPAADTAAIVTKAAVTDLCNILSGIAWSYGSSGTLAGGNLKVEDGAGTTVFSLDISAKGQDCVYFDPPLRGSVNTALVVTLAAGGANVVGKVNLLGHWLGKL